MLKYFSLNTALAVAHVRLNNYQSFRIGRHESFSYDRANIVAKRKRTVRKAGQLSLRLGSPTEISGPQERQTKHTMATSTLPSDFTASKPQRSLRIESHLDGARSQNAAGDGFG